MTGIVLIISGSVLYVYSKSGAAAPASTSTDLKAMERGMAEPFLPEKEMRANR